MTAASVRRCLVLVLLGVQTGAPLASILRGQVVAVTDGDTLTVADGRHRKTKIRLNGIDAPEKDQPYGRESRAHLKSLLLGKAVDVEWNKRDAYERIVGRVLLAPSGCAACDKRQDAGLAQVTAGYAWWYRSESRELSHVDKSRYALAENSARARHRGLWAAPAPTPPWQWRHSQPGQASAPLAKTRIPIRQATTRVRHPICGVRRWIRS